MNDQRLAEAERLLRDAMSVVGDLLNFWPERELQIPPEGLRDAVNAWLLDGRRAPLD